MGLGAALTGAIAVARDPNVNVEELDRFASGRVDGYREGLIIFRERPLLGHGIRSEGTLLTTIDKATQLPELIEIHNLWLKWGVYFGAAAPLGLLAMAAVVLFTAWRAMREGTGKERRYVFALGVILGLGLVASMFEPNALAGNFRYTAIWWAAAGAVAGLRGRGRDGGGDAAGAGGVDV